MASNLAHRREILHKAFERMGIEPADTYELVEAIVTPVEASQEPGNQGERLDERIDGVEKSLNAAIKAEGKRLDERIDGVEKSLNAAIKAEGERLDERIDGVEKRLDERIDGVEKRLDTAIKAEGRRLDERIDEMGRRISTLQAIVIAFGTAIMGLLTALFIRIG